MSDEERSALDVVDGNRQAVTIDYGVASAVVVSDEHTSGEECTCGVFLSSWFSVLTGMGYIRDQ